MVIKFRFGKMFDSDMSVFYFLAMLYIDYKFSVKSRLLNSSRVLIFGLSLQMCKPLVSVANECLLFGL